MFKSTIQQHVCLCSPGYPGSCSCRQSFNAYLSFQDAKIKSMCHNTQHCILESRPPGNTFLHLLGLQSTTDQSCQMSLHFCFTEMKSNSVHFCLASFLSISVFNSIHVGFFGAYMVHLLLGSVLLYGFTAIHSLFILKVCTNS